MKKRYIAGGIVAGIVIISVATSGGSDEKPTTESKPQTSASQTAKSQQEEKLSAAEEFRAFVNKSGLPAEKEAAKHVTKIQGADEQNNILDSADVYTDYTGNVMSGDAAKGKLIASAFADWKDSDNGLVTVYNASGEILSNGNF